MMMRQAIGVCLLLMCTVQVWANDLFSVHVQTVTGTPLEQTVGGSSLVDLVRDLVETRRDFAQFEGRDIHARVQYAGVRNAILLDVNAAGTEARLRIPATGLDRTFSEEHGDLDDQIRDFLLEEGATGYAQFLREINRRSPVAVTDGNPRATTAFQADQAFNRYAFFSGWNLAHRSARSRGWGSRIDLSVGSFSTDVADGTFIAGGLSTSYRFTQRVALASAIPVQYRDVEGARVYDVGGELALPIRLLLGRDTLVGWQVTPMLLGAGSFSADMAAGGVMIGAGLASSAAWHLGDLTLTLGNQLTFHEGTPLRVGDYRLETDLSQQILKNGLKATVNLGRPIFLDGSLVHTHFLQDAAVRNYWTPGVGVGLRLGQRAGLRVGYSADLASGYTSHNGQATLFLGW